jgi:hypothetical protein
VLGVKVPRCTQCTFTPVSIWNCLILRRLCDKAMLYFMLLRIGYAATSNKMLRQLQPLRLVVGFEVFAVDGFGNFG